MENCPDEILYIIFTKNFLEFPKYEKHIDLSSFELTGC